MVSEDRGNLRGKIKEDIADSLGLQLRRFFRRSTAEEGLDLSQFSQVYEAPAAYYLPEGLRIDADLVRCLDVSESPLLLRGQ
jgi:hypothetical protein